MKSLTVATRGGALALAQTRHVIATLKKIHPGLEIGIKEITTTGDKDRRTALWTLKETGFFTSQVEDALTAYEADFAVHSFKDLPTAQREGLIIGAVFDRNFVEDCLVTKQSIDSIDQLPANANIGTSSLRRIAQLKHLRADLILAPIRGNVQTRLRKLNEVQFDDKNARITTAAERKILTTMQCGCHAPVGAYAEIDGGDIHISAFISDLQGENFIRREHTGPVKDAEKLAEKIANELLEAGGREILESLEK
jgi:hydroxymethylbilane synthase